MGLAKRFGNKPNLIAIRDICHLLSECAPHRSVIREFAHSRVFSAANIIWPYPHKLLEMFLEILKSAENKYFVFVFEMFNGIIVHRLYAFDPFKHLHLRFLRPK